MDKYGFRLNSTFSKLAKAYEYGITPSQIGTQFGISGSRPRRQLIAAGHRFERRKSTLEYKLIPNPSAGMVQGNLAVPKILWKPHPTQHDIEYADRSTCPEPRRKSPP